MIDCIVWDRCNCCTNIKFAYRSVSQNISKCHILIWNQIQGHVDRLLFILKIYISVWVGQIAIAYISHFPNHDNVDKEPKRLVFHIFCWKCDGKNLAFHCPPPCRGNPLTFVKDQRETSMALFTLLNFTLFHRAAKSKSFEMSR